ncbi:GDSL lipase/esterase [Arabidopsis suecica]|uniref:GDSL lipase/esterase n=1 Tax=Arabidopsis suecica TaxID=45249 RepID=A0A8T2H7B8_ARASU|nr:GDSL lipase/esterase [Arabidopsis suecica]
MENANIKVLVVLLSIWISCVQAQTGTFSAVLAFGDSILDTGNNNLLMTVSRGNFLPYGRDFPHRIPTGRFGNGRVLSDLVASGLGVKDLLPAFRSPFLKNSELATGVCFASGGSGLDKFTASIQGVIWVQDQSLYDLGARKFAILGTLPLGCLPGARQITGNLICLPNVNYGARVYNDKVANLVNQYNQRLPNGKFVYIDMYNSLLEVINNPSQYGFTTAKPCCCSVMTPIPCLRSGSHVFWDFAHPSEKAYKTVLPKILSTIQSNLA